MNVFCFLRVLQLIIMKPHWHLSFSVSRFLIYLLTIERSVTSSACRPSGMSVSYFAEYLWLMKVTFTCISSYVISVHVGSANRVGAFPLLSLPVCNCRVFLSLCVSSTTPPVRPSGLSWTLTGGMKCPHTLHKWSGYVPSLPATRSVTCHEVRASVREVS